MVVTVPWNIDLTFYPLLYLWSPQGLGFRGHGRQREGLKVRNGMEEGEEGQDSGSLLPTWGPLGSPVVV